MDNLTTPSANVPDVVKKALALQNIDTSKCNLMLPTETYGEVLGMFNKITFESIKVDPTPAHKEVYEPDGPGKGKALGKVPLQRIAIAMGIIWDPVTTGIVEDTETKSRARATGALRKPNGEPVIITEEKTINAKVLGERDRLSIEEKADRGNPDKVKKWGKTESGKSFPSELEPWKDDAEKERYIDRAVRKAVIQHQLSKNEKANTGAKERVIRAFIAMKSTYTDEELALPFVYPCVSIDSAKMLATPELQAAAIRNMDPSITAIFGNRPDRNAIDVSPPKQIPHTVDTQTQEMVEGSPAAAAEEGQLGMFPEGKEEQKPEPSAVDKLKAVLRGQLEKIPADLAIKQGNVRELIQKTLDKQDATAVEINAWIDRCNQYFQNVAAKGGAA